MYPSSSTHSFQGQPKKVACEEGDHILQPHHPRLRNDSALRRCVWMRTRAPSLSRRGMTAVWREALLLQAKELLQGLPINRLKDGSDGRLVKSLKFFGHNLVIIEVFQIVQVRH